MAEREDEFGELNCEIAKIIMDPDDWEDIIYGENDNIFIHLKQEFLPFDYKGEKHTILKNVQYLEGYEGIEYLVFRLPRKPDGTYGLIEVSTAQEREAIESYLRSLPDDDGSEKNDVSNVGGGNFGK